QVGHGVRWSLPRSGAYWPRWEGTLTDTRIAYMTPRGLRVVAGDGTGDRLLARHPDHVAPAWDPTRLPTIPSPTGGAIELRNVDPEALVWRAPIAISPTSLSWSSDGKLLAVLSPRRVVVLGVDGKPRRTISTLGARFLDAAFRPGTHDLALSIHDQG